MVFGSFPLFLLNLKAHNYQYKPARTSTGQPHQPIRLMSEGSRRLSEHVLAIAEHGVLIGDLLAEMADGLERNG